MDEGPANWLQIGNSHWFHCRDSGPATNGQLSRLIQANKTLSWFSSVPFASFWFWPFRAIQLF